MIPDPEEHRARIGAALRRLRDPASGLPKVVLARALRLVANGPLDPRSVVHRLVATDAAANAYLVDLTAAGGGTPAPLWSVRAPSCWLRGTAIR